MNRQELYIIPEQKREEIWNKLIKIESSVAQSKAIVQNEMPLSQEDELYAFYDEINEIIEELKNTKNMVNNSKKLSYVKIYNDEGEIIESLCTGGLK